MKDSLEDEVKLLRRMEVIDKHHKFHPKFYGYLAIKSESVHDSELKDAVYELSDPVGDMYEVVTAYGGLSLSDGKATIYFKNAGAEKRLRMVKALLEGLQRMHDKGLVHGDLHGGNILLDVDAGQFNIIDFGRVMHPDEFAQDVVYEWWDYRLHEGATNYVWPKDPSLHDVIIQWANHDPEAANKNAVQRLETVVQSPEIIQRLVDRVPNKQLRVFSNNPNYCKVLEEYGLRVSDSDANEDWKAAVKGFAALALKFAKKIQPSEADAKLPRKVNQKNRGRSEVEIALTQAYSTIAPNFDAYSIGFTLLNFAEPFVLHHHTDTTQAWSKDIEIDRAIIIALVGLLRTDPFQRRIPGKMAEFLNEVLAANRQAV